MSYSIFNSDQHLVVQYKADHNAASLTFLDPILENDIRYGLSVPFHLQRNFNGRTVLPYPPPKSEIQAFAVAYKQIIFDGELIKHGFYYRDDSGPITSKIQKA